MYLHIGAEFVFARFHAPEGRKRDVAVVFCPPFGWEEMSSYGPRREWAEHLAAEGVAALRFDLPGSGDSSGSPHDAGRLDAWTHALDGAVRWLRQETGCGRVAVIGISLGGMLAVRALSQGTPIDDLVLWGVPARGRTFLREVNAFARMESAMRAEAGDVDEPDGLPDGSLSAGGYIINAETRSALAELDLTSLALPEGDHRVLLLQRDGIRVDPKLQAHLVDSGLPVTVTDGRGYAGMLVEPQFARAPLATLASVSAWLDTAPPPSEPPGAVWVAPATTSYMDLNVDGVPLRETPVRLAHDGGDIFAIMTTPRGGDPAKAAAVLLGGTGHRIGPNRMWVEIARRWAARGVPSIRVDLSGAGDAGGEIPADVAGLHAPLFTEQVRAILEDLSDRGMPDRFVLLGLCAGAYWALHTALQDDHTVLPYMLNLRVFSWDDQEHTRRMSQHYRRLLFRRSTWQRLLNGDISLSRPSRVLVTRAATQLRSRRLGLASGGASSDAVREQTLDRLNARSPGSLMLFTGHEDVYEDLKRNGGLQRLARWPKLRVEAVPGRSDLHTMRPIWLQRRVHTLVDQALTDDLANVP